MRRIRDLQDETRGFRAFISWTFQRDGNRLDDVVADEDMPTSFDYLLTQAVSRIYLDNVPHIQSSWVTQGMKVGQVALAFGAGPVTDAFFVAYRIPNILRRLLGEGALSTAVVPVFTQYTTLRSREEHTFSQMRIDRGGPRSFSALCFRGWRRD